jgi:hypothetical protein
MLVVSHCRKGRKIKSAAFESPAVMLLLLFTATVGFLALLPLGSGPAMAQEYIRDEEVTPESVDQLVSPMELSFQEKAKIPRFFPWLKEQLKDTPAFFRDTKLNLNIRSFYLYRDKYDPGDKIEAGALGGALAYQSGWFLDRFSIGSVLYTSQELYGPDTRDGTLLLKPRQQGYTVVGQLYARVKLVEDNFLNLYRYEYNTPYINKNDNRMTPNTFEGYTFNGTYGGKEGALGFRYGGGYITKIKERNSDEFVWMSRDAGADVNRGVFVGGANMSYKGLTFGAINYYSDDIINIFYTEGSYKLKLTERLGLLFAAQYTDQRSVGRDLLKGFSFDTEQLGLRGDLSYGGAVLSFGYTTDGEGADLQSPWSGYPGYTSVQVQDFNRAGESAYIAKASYDFTKLGLKGVTAYVLYVHGWGRVDPTTRNPLPDENELNLDLQYRPHWDFLKGLWFRTRYANVRQYEGPKHTQDDFRFIVNYDIPLL